MRAEKISRQLMGAQDQAPVMALFLCIIINVFLEIHIGICKLLFDLLVSVALNPRYIRIRLRVSAIEDNSE